MAIIINDNLTADGVTTQANIVNPNTGASPYQVIYASGNFGSGTLAIEISNDGGTTWFAATDSAGAVEFTAAGAARIFLLGNGNPIADEQIKIRGNLSGSSSPDLNVTVSDCR